jgi:hypothetical protein
MDKLTAATMATKGLGKLNFSVGRQQDPEATDA